MATYKISVTVVAEAEYEVEVETSSEAKAEDLATAMWREKTPDGFQVDKGYITDWQTESEQTSWECHECGLDISEAIYRRNDEMCDDCLKKYDAEAA